MLLFVAFIFPIIVFFFESYPRFLNRNVGVDIWTHLLYLKEYHRQKGIPKRIENGFLVPGEYDYPPAFIWILSKFPFHLVEKYEFLFSPFFDAIHLVIIFSLSYYLTQNIWVAFLTQVLYALTPIIIIENSSATPRSLGYTLFTIVFVSIFLYQFNYRDPFLLVAALFFGTLIFLSHRFTTQGFLFFSIFFSVITGSVLYISIFLLSALLAIVLSKGFYLKVLRGHIGNLIFWYNNIDVRFAHQVKGNYKEHKTKDFVFRIYNQFLKFPPFVLAITNPWTLPVLLLAIFYPLDFFAIGASEVYGALAMIVPFSYVLSLVTIWVPKLRFLGEGQRYLELSAFPAAFTSAWLVFATTGILKSIVLVLYVCVAVGSLITIVVIQRKAIIKDRLRSLTPSMLEMFAYLKSLKDKPKLLCIPHQITTNTIYHTGCPVFVNADYATIQKISDVYPVLRKPIGEIMEKHGLNMILLNTDYATIEDLKIKKYSVVKRVENFVLLRPQG